MPKDPLEILALDQQATASFFSEVNKGIASAAAVELNAARQASNIIDTTVKARELKRVNDQSIRSAIITDNINQRNSEMQEQRFRADMELMPLKVANEQMRMKIEMLQVETEAKKQFVEGAEYYLKFHNANQRQEALAYAFENGGDPYLIMKQAEIDEKALAAIKKGHDPEEVARIAKLDFDKAKKNIPASSGYTPATLSLIAKHYGAEVADQMDLEYNENRQAERRAQQSTLIAIGEDDAVFKAIQQTRNPEERERLQKAWTLRKDAEARKKANSDILKKLTTDHGFIQHGTPDSLEVPTPEGFTVPYNTLEDTSKDPNVFTKERLIRLHKSAIDKANEDISRAVQSVQSGVDINAVRFSDEVTNQSVEGGSGQRQPQGLLSDDSKKKLNEDLKGDLKESEAPLLEFYEGRESKRFERTMQTLPEKLRTEEDKPNEAESVLEKVLTGISMPDQSLSSKKQIEEIESNVNVSVNQLSDQEKSFLLDSMIKRKTKGYLQGQNRSLVARLQREKNEGNRILLKDAILKNAIVNFVSHNVK